MVATAETPVLAVFALEANALMANVATPCQDKKPAGKHDMHTFPTQARNHHTNPTKPVDPRHRR